MKKYIPLHCHSMYSLLDGLSKPSQIAERCLEIGATACALTDHGNIAGAIKFHKEMTKNKIKPILGCEIYICHNDATIQSKENKDLSHFIVLAKNLEGWIKLINLVSESNRPDVFYHKPRVDLDILSKFIDGNMIGFCGHLGSLLADKIICDNRIIDDWKSVGVSLIEKLKNIFGEDNFFLEAQLMDKENTPLQIELTNIIRELGKITNTKIICTPDAHYTRKEDAVDQRILLCTNLKTTLPEISKKISNGQEVPLSCFFLSDNFHILSQEEMNGLHTEEEIENTQLVADMCEFYDITSRPNLPPFDCGGGGPDEFLRQLCRNGWKEKIANIIPKEDQQIYIDRIKYELDILQGAGLSSYFLIVQDIVNYVRSQNWLPGPGRGSAAGCLVSYLIGITNIDPIQYSLLFDRFYNSGRNTSDRVSMPDIDVDVPIEKREEIIAYIKRKYGDPQVSQMVTFNTIKGRGAIKDVLRAYGNISFDEMNDITKNIPDEAKIADDLQEMKDEHGEASIIRWALENQSEKLKEWCFIGENGQLEGPLAKRFEQAIRLEGTKVNQSKHAAGVAIASQALSTLCPIVFDSKSKTKIAGMEMEDLESIGVVKFDILGVAMLDKIMFISDFLKTEGIKK
jgi:DNA polymerase-3 subunit alpha